ncbi:MAG: anaerobic ribonucleoside-triphosphate reductase activating protein [Pseudomonadota bacterium]
MGGVTPFTATDYPGKLSAVVFVQGCPWRCGYCHNPHLQDRNGGAELWIDVLEFLARRIGLIDAVVFSGGEPVIDPALPQAMADVRALGYKVGLHTACIYPRQLSLVLPLVDWVGFDIKAPFALYPRITKAAGSGGAARECAKLILASGIDYECRTTIHPGLLAEDEIEELAVTLASLGVRNYALQAFRSQGCADSMLNGINCAGYPSAGMLERVASLFDEFTFRQHS